MDAGRAYGAELITAYELHETGMEHMLARIPDGGHDYLAVDLAGCARPSKRLLRHPVTAAPPSRGRANWCTGPVRKGRVVGMDVVEITPATDANRITCSRQGG